MVTVTRDKRKYGAPTVYSDAQRKKWQQDQRERELARQIEDDISRGRREGYSGRIKPLLFED